MHVLELISTAMQVGVISNIHTNDSFDYFWP